MVNINLRRSTDSDGNFFNDHAARIVARNAYSQDPNFTCQRIVRWLDVYVKGRGCVRCYIGGLIGQRDVPARPGFGEVRALVGVAGVNQLER